MDSCELCCSIDTYKASLQGGIELAVFDDATTSLIIIGLIGLLGTITETVRSNRSSANLTTLISIRPMSCASALAVKLHFGYMSAEVTVKNKRAAFSRIISASPPQHTSIYIDDYGGMHKLTDSTTASNTIRSSVPALSYGTVANLQHSGAPALLPPGSPPSNKDADNDPNNTTTTSTSNSGNQEDDDNDEQVVEYSRVMPVYYALSLGAAIWFLIQGLGLFLPNSSVLQPLLQFLYEGHAFFDNWIVIYAFFNIHMNYAILLTSIIAAVLMAAKLSFVVRQCRSHRIESTSRLDSPVVPRLHIRYPIHSGIEYE